MATTLETTITPIFNVLLAKKALNMCFFINMPLNVVWTGLCLSVEVSSAADFTVRFFDVTLRTH